MDKRWAPIHRSYDWVQCHYCGDAMERDHEAVNCELCGTLQCKRRAEFAVCLVGYLPGWSSRDNKGGHGIGFGRPRYCGYAKCSANAVAKAPRVGAVCLEHAKTCKERGVPVAERASLVVARLAEPRLADGWERVSNLRWHGDSWYRIAS